MLREVKHESEMNLIPLPVQSCTVQRQRQIVCCLHPHHSRGSIETSVPPQVQWTGEI